MSSTQGAFVLGPLGLSEIEERIYRLLLGRPGWNARAITNELDLRSAQTTAALKSLEGTGLIGRRSRAEGGFVATPPNLALEVLHLKRRQELDRSIELAQSLIGGVQIEASVGEAITVVEGTRAFGQQCAQIQKTAGEQMRWFDKPLLKHDPEISVSPPQFNSFQTEQMAKGIIYRTVYEGSTLEEQDMRWIAGYVEAGERARVVEELPVALMIADEKVALIAFHRGPNDPTKGAAIVRSPGMVTALSTLFEAVWEKALPFGVSDPQAVPELTGLDHAIISLMVAGVKDETIAHRLGVNPSTVRRHIKEMLATLGARTRFQAGIQATKRGWL